MQCQFCGRSIERDTAWMGSSNKFFCSEFCSEADTGSEAPELDRRYSQQKIKIDQQYLERLERLQRLLPQLRRLSPTGLAS